MHCLLVLIARIKKRGGLIGSQRHDERVQGDGQAFPARLYISLFSRPAAKEGPDLVLRWHASQCIYLLRRKEALRNVLFCHPWTEHLDVDPHAAVAADCVKCNLTRMREVE